MSEELSALIPLPCPFCGSKDVDVYWLRDGGGSYAVNCNGCQTEGPASGDRVVAIQHWNQRASLSALLGAVLPTFAASAEVKIIRGDLLPDHTMMVSKDLYEIVERLPKK